MPFQWTINPIEAANSGCKYCYARYTFEFMELPVTDFEDRIFAKSASAHLLAQELRRHRPPGNRSRSARRPILTSRRKRRYGRTRSILEVFAREKGWRLGMVTKVGPGETREHRPAARGGAAAMCFRST